MTFFDQTRVRREAKGFTLIELMVTLTIAAILLMVAVPNISQMIASSAVSSNVNSFLADMRFARSEAIRRGGEVALCRVTNPDAANPTCLTIAGTDGWVTGWIVFEDLNSDGTKDANEPVLRRQAALTLSGTIFEGTAASTKFRFLSSGRLRGIANATTLNFRNPFEPSFDSSTNIKLERVVCVAASGRTRIAGNGSTTCA